MLSFLIKNQNLEKSLIVQSDDMLRIVPNDYIQFPRGDPSESLLQLNNTSKQPVTFKVSKSMKEFDQKFDAILFLHFLSDSNYITGKVSCAPTLWSNKSG